MQPPTENHEPNQKRNHRQVTIIAIAVCEGDINEEQESIYNKPEDAKAFIENEFADLAESLFGEQSVTTVCLIQQNT